MTFCISLADTPKYLYVLVLLFFESRNVAIFFYRVLCSDARSFASRFYKLCDKFGKKLWERTYASPLYVFVRYSWHLEFFHISCT